MHIIAIENAFSKGYHELQIRSPPCRVTTSGHERVQKQA